jgi:hypothetical protein
MALKAKITELRALMAAPVAGGQFRGPGPFELEVVREPGIPYDLTLSIAFASGRYRCTSLTALPRKGGPPITAAGLRSIPVGALVRRSVQDQVVLVRDKTSPAPGVTKLSLGSSPFPRPAPEPGRRRRHTRDDVEAAAVVYAVAQMCGEPPTKAVTDELGIPLGTARKLVARARESGLLPAAP